MKKGMTTGDILAIVLAFFFVVIVLIFFTPFMQNLVNIAGEGILLMLQGLVKWVCTHTVGTALPSFC